ncbi:kinase-like protein [Exidia glandulosa HHB12029]|uniref:Kinase-like protein n=1 Tax=Exidia glandulosa HHB12029 TaxID=1314781 RepID=A0A165MSV9_EXIGL|nr:kinase-like protein [Exidia glandulosa HHB12029]
MSATRASDAKASLDPWLETRGIRTLVKVRTVSMTVLAKGGSADVYKARWRGQWVVRKIFRGDPKANQKRIRRELENWRLVRHIHVQELLGVHWTGEVPALVSPFYEFTSLHAYIQYCLCYMTDIFVNRLKAELLCQVLRGLDYLHQHPCRPMVHGDIKASNIFVTKNGIAVIGDFGTCRAVTPRRAEAISRPWPHYAPVKGISPESSCSSALNLNGTLRWMAPELVIEEDPVHTVRTDIWAFGCLILEVMSGEAPFSGCNDVQVIIALSNPDSSVFGIWREEVAEEEDYMLKEQKKIREEIRLLKAKLRKLNAPQ